MRIISDELLDLVAGGRGKIKPADDQSTVYQTITITGKAPTEDPPPLNPPPVQWNDLGTVPLKHITPHHTSPLPKNIPNGVNMDDLRNAADDVGKHLQQLTDADGKEHGAFIILYPDGSLHLSPVSTGDEGSIITGADLTPGEVIVAWIHDHPEAAGVSDEREPSPTDIYNTQAMIANNPKVVDPNMLLYITDATGDQWQGQTFEYPNTTSATNPKLGADISNDYGPGA